MKKQRQRAAKLKVRPFSKEGRRKHGRDRRFERNSGVMAKWRRKVCLKQDWKCSSEGSSVDRISMLPDEVLGLILSHFTFKEQVTFSILSRRWRYMWALTTSLDFDGITKDSLERLRQEKGTSLGKEKLNYVSWVNRVVASCQSPTIEDFRVCFSLSKNEAGYINKWLRYALEKKVKTLVLDFTDNLARRGVDECYVLLPYRSLHIDEEFHFKQLEKLSLDYVSVDGEALNFFLHNCPLLEDLSVSNSSELLSLSVAGPFRSLKRLVVSLCCNLDLLDIRDTNLVYLGYEGHNIQLRLHNLPKLVNLSVPMEVFMYINDAALLFPGILEQLEALYIHDFRRFFFAVKMSNLKHLEITYVLDGALPILGTLPDIIRTVPKLQKFVLKVMHLYQGVGLCKPELVRPKMKKKSYHQLKELEFVGFLGQPIELGFIWHFVDNAIGLKRVVIDPTVLVARNGHMSRKESYSNMQILALDQAEKQLALEVPSKIKLDFLRPPQYPSRLDFLRPPRYRV